MAINQLSFMPGYSTDPMAETEEQRRQREEQERIQRESAMLAGLPGVASGAVNPMTMSPEVAANTEVSSTQIKTYGDGSQEEIIKRQIPAEGAVNPMAAQAPMDPLAQSQQNLNVLTPELTPEQQAQAAQIEALAAQQAGAAQPQAMAQPQQQPMSMAQQAAAGLPQAQAQPQTMPQAAPVSPDQAMPEVGTPPVPGPGVQVASAAPGAGVAEAASQMFTGQGIQPRLPAQRTDYDLFVSAADNPMSLMQIYNDKSADPVYRRLAGKEVAAQLSNETKRAAAEEQVSRMTSSEIARELRKSSEEGSWPKRILFGLLNMKSAMEAEDAKLGIGAKYQSAMVNGEPVLVKIRADGKPMEGINTLTKQPMTQRELVAAAASITAAKDIQVGADTFADPTGTVPGNWVLERKPGGSVYRQIGTNAIATPEQANALRKTGVQGTLADQRAALAQKANIGLVSDLLRRGVNNIQDAKREYVTKQGPFGTTKNPLTEQEFDSYYAGQLNLPNINTAVGVNTTGGAMAPAPAAAATTTPTAATTTPTAAPTPAAAAAPAPTAAAAPAPAGRVGGGGRVGGVGVTPSTGFVSGSDQALREKQQGANIDIATTAAKERIQTQETAPREFIKLNAAAASEASKAAASAPQLLATLDRITNTLEQRPDFANSLRSPAFTAFVVAQDADKQKRYEELAQVAQLRNERDKTQFQGLVNDLRKLEVAGITQSGLAASQLNTERESQRVVDALAISLRNTPQAARVQAEIAKAQIQYQRRFAQYLASADPTQNPAAIRSRFDETIGDKIYSDLAPKLEAIARGGVVDFRSPR